MNGFKQVRIAYLAAFRFLVQPSYTLCTQIRPKATSRACLATLDNFDLRVVPLMMQQLSQLINGDVILPPAKKVSLIILTVTK